MKIKPVTGALIGLTAAGAAYVLVQKRKEAASIETARPVEIHGFVSPGYEAVREAFAENFSLRREIGAACCVYHKGEKVVHRRRPARRGVTARIVFCNDSRAES